MKNGPLGDGSGQKLPSHHGVGSAGPRHGAYLLGRSALKWRVPGVTTGSPRRAEARCLLTGKVSFEIAGPRGHHGVTTMGGCTAGTLIGTLGPGVRVKHLTMAGESSRSVATGCRSIRDSAQLDRAVLLNAATGAVIH